ncbi:NrfG FOG, TPR repeat [Paracoccaceae bacterium]
MFPRVLPTRPQLALVALTLAASPAYAQTCEDRIDDYALRIQLCDDAFAAAADPDAAALALSMKGEAQRMLGDLSGAAATLQQALGITPANAWVWVELGNVRYDEGDHAGALAHYSAALAVEDYADAWANRAEAWWEFGMDQNCSDDADQALRLDTQYPYANEVKGRCLVELDQSEEALTYFDTAIALYPAYQNAYRNKLAALDNLGRYEDLVAAADIALDPAVVPNPSAAIEEDILSRRLLALAKFAPADKVAAEADALLARYPNGLAAINIKARALLAQNKAQEADTMTGPLRQNTDGQTMQAIYFDTLAQIDVMLGRLDAARGNYQAAIDQDPGLSKVYARKVSELGFLPLSNAPDGVMTALGRCLDVKKTACLVSAE